MSLPPRHRSPSYWHSGRSRFPATGWEAPGKPAGAFPTTVSAHRRPRRRAARGGQIGGPGLPCAQRRRRMPSGNSSTAPSVMGCVSPFFQGVLVWNSPPLAPLRRGFSLASAPPALPTSPPSHSDFEVRSGGLDVGRIYEDSRALSHPCDGTGRSMACTQAPP
jgi:hypothetical protein